MNITDDYIELVRQAQRGDTVSRDRLCELLQPYIRSYIYRITMNNDLTEEIIQESMIEMIKFLDKLEEAEKFWPWLRKIAISKLSRHHRAKPKAKIVSISEGGLDCSEADTQDGLAKLVRDELQETVSAAMAKLRYRHRRVLTLRCYEQMQYREIAEELECSEFAARMLFIRAKRALARQLARRGLGKGALLTALVVFGKMTAPTEAAATTISVSAGTVKAGVAATVAGVALSKTAVVTVGTAAVVAVGTSEFVQYREAPAAEGRETIRTARVLGEQRNVKERVTEYFYPERPDGAVMIRVMQDDKCVYLGDYGGNYHFDESSGTGCIANYHLYNKDLSVWRMPGDGEQLREFLDSSEGVSDRYEVHEMPSAKAGLFARTEFSSETNRFVTRFNVHKNMMFEDYFRPGSNWAGKLIDKRDNMHVRGWTYFEIDGSVGGEKVCGSGRVPFTYMASKQHHHWLRLEIGDRTLIDANGAVLFYGLGRPWMGMHTIDTIRRDAGKVGKKSEVRIGKSEVKVVIEDGQNKLIYTIDMQRDLVEKIVFSGDSEGELNLTYLDDIENIGDEFITPKTTRLAEIKNSNGVEWLLSLNSKH